MTENEAELQPMDLPAPAGEFVAGNQMPESDVMQQGSERNTEFLPNTQNTPSMPAVSDNGSALPAEEPGGVLPDADSGDSSGPDVGGVVSDMPAIADDVDLIEKEWVEKAKEVVAKTQDNPYLQNKAISEIKAEYIRKRYNKDLTRSGD